MIKGPKMVYRQGSKLLGVTKITIDRGLNRETQRSQRTRVFGDDRVIRSMGRGDPPILGATEDLIMIITKY